MRIAFVARRWWPAVGGAETFMRHVAHGLAARHEVRVLAGGIDRAPATRLSDSLRPPPRFEPFDDHGVHVQPLRLPLARRLALAPLLAHVTPGLRRYAYGRSRAWAARLYSAVAGPVIARETADSEVLHMWGSDLVAAAAVHGARLARVPVVVTPFAHEGQWGDDPASARAYREADAVVALLDAEAAVYRRLGVPNERLEVCGICSPGLPRGPGEAMRRRHAVDGPLVLFLGVRRPYKGHDLLLQAAPRVAAARPDVTFAFVGPGEALGANDGARVIDVGEADEQERGAWLDAADLLCLPSAGEIFPVSILEAWSVGTPVLTSDLPTLQELIDRSGGGATVSRQPAALADAILRLLGDRERLRVAGESGRMFWEANHTVEAIARRHEELYARLVRGATG